MLDEPAMRDYIEKARAVRAIPATSRVEMMLRGVRVGWKNNENVTCPNCGNKFFSGHFDWKEITPQSGVFDAVYICPSCDMTWLVPASIFDRGKKNGK
jgi:predicted RNA-binding Zn-ribbon protein involved in translation (DUF1610 family)